MLEVLPRVIPPAPGNEPRPPDEYLPMQEVTRQVALEGGWTGERAQRIRQLFDSLAADWHTRGGPERAAPVEDMLTRGGLPRGGRCLEVGSGTGLQTPALATHFGDVISIDLSSQMLALAPRHLGPLVMADTAALPFCDGGFDAVVCINAFLLPEEQSRVLAGGGAIAFVSTIGASTPIYLPPEDVMRALPGTWRGVTSEACWGTWTVARRPETKS